MTETAASIVIIDYGSGNLRSAEKAFLRHAKGRKLAVSGRPQDIKTADHIILPGVGAFGDCARGLAAIDGMMEALNERVLTDGRPFLGICVGMQLMCRYGLERGRHQGLGWLEADVTPLETPAALKVPHMGWNRIDCQTAHPVSDGVHGQDVYFVHSYAARALSESGQKAVLAQTDYGGPVTAIVGRDNILGVQFHPEKSQAAGLGLIERFLEWRP